MNNRLEESSNVSKNRSSSSVGSLDLSSIQDSNQSWYPQDLNALCSPSTVCGNIKDIDSQRHGNEDGLQNIAKQHPLANTVCHSTDIEENSRPTIASPDDECGDMDSCTMDMSVQRECLRKRFKEWSDKMNQTLRRLRDVTDNALVNQNMQLEHILDKCKGRIDEIEEEQSRIRTQLSGFVSILSDAQSHIFVERRDCESNTARSRKNSSTAPAQRSVETRTVNPPGH
ncbi:hypothetical protein H4217_002216 [Coemansia sp. RSA 1939]|nr:hypothetical protein H4217_002216 [Coemansia sp. RSA 1939]